MSKYIAKGRMNLSIWGKKKEAMKTPKKKTILKASANRAFLQSNHKETQYAVETIAKATTMP
tara:strand:+ start:244 stop:429 length:186 start_codon:yes stop_codon:yes gene_type:complete